MNFPSSFTKSNLLKRMNEFDYLTNLKTGGSLVGNFLLFSLSMSSFEVTRRMQNYGANVFKITPSDVFCRSSGKLAEDTKFPNVIRQLSSFANILLI